jgi:tetratricopeptide (TPR) repeat protein
MYKLIFLTTMLCLFSSSTWGQSMPPVTNSPAKASTPPANADPIREADRLFTHGEDTARDHQVLAMLASALAADTNNYQLLWRASRSYYYVGDNTVSAEKLPYFERGIEAGQRAVTQQPNGVEGHFWLGANYGGYSQETGMFKALSTIKKMRTEMETVLRLNPRYEEGNAYLALGELDRQLPGILGGDNKRAISYLEQGLSIAPQHMKMKLALAEAYRAAKRHDDARRQLQEILQMPLNPTHAGSNHETQEKARQLLNK